MAYAVIVLKMVGVYAQGTCKVTRWESFDYA